MELLVVIVIVVILSSAMIPIMSAASDSRRLREGARSVAAMLASAQSRAISSGRSVGVLFQRMKNNPAASMELYLVEVPPPYSGDDAGYTATIGQNGTTATIMGANGSGTPTFGGLPVNQQVLIRPGDLIRFNYRGQLYVVNYGDTTNPYLRSNTFNITPTDPTASYPPATPAGSAGVPFQIYRQPLKTVDPPVQLSDGAAVDLYFSGIDLAPANSNSATTSSVFGTLGLSSSSSPVIITFSSAGTLEQVYYSAGAYPAASGNAQVRPIAGVYLLVGKVERIPNPLVSPNLTFTPPNPAPNYQDSDCRWVSVTRQSGLATAAEVALVPGSSAPGATLSAQDIINIMQSRRYASGNQSSGGI